MKIGVIGFGYWGPNIVRNLLLLEHDVCIFDRDPMRVSAAIEQFPRAAAAWDLKDILDDTEVQAVAIATPLPQHPSLCLSALAAGKHVFVEKPLCATVEEVDIINQHVNGQVLAVGHITHFCPGIRALGDSLRRGELGELCCLSLVRTHLGPIYFGTDVLTEVAAHDVAVVLSLRADPPRKVQAWGARRLGLDGADSAHVVLNWEDGVFAQIDAGWTSARRQREITIEGTRGTLRYENLEGHERLSSFCLDKAFDGLRGGSPPSEIRELARLETINLTTVEPLREELRSFIECVKARKTPEMNVTFARGVVGVLEAARRSMTTGGREELIPS